MTAPPAAILSLPVGGLSVAAAAAGHRGDNSIPLQVDEVVPLLPAAHSVARAVPAIGIAVEVVVITIITISLAIVLVLGPALTTRPSIGMAQRLTAPKAAEPNKPHGHKRSNYKRKLGAVMVSVTPKMSSVGV